MVVIAVGSRLSDEQVDVGAGVEEGAGEGDVAGDDGELERGAGADFAVCGGGVGGDGDYGIDGRLGGVDERCRFGIVAGMNCAHEGLGEGWVDGDGGALDGRRHGMGEEGGAG